MRCAVHRNLVLVHRLEQRALCLRRGAVDLVGQHDLGDHRAGPKLELAALLIEDRDTGDIGRQQVGRELDALERAADRARDRLRQHGLAGARHIFQQHMAFAHQRDQHQLNRLTLADNHFFDIGGDPINRLFNILHTAPLIDLLISGIAPRKYTITCDDWRCAISRTLILFSFACARLGYRIRARQK